MLLFEQNLVTVLSEIDFIFNVLPRASESVDEIFDVAIIIKRNVWFTCSTVWYRTQLCILCCCMFDSSDKTKRVLNRNRYRLFRSISFQMSCKLLCLSFLRWQKLESFKFDDPKNFTYHEKLHAVANIQRIVRQTFLFAIGLRIDFEES